MSSSHTRVAAQGPLSASTSWRSTMDARRMIGATFIGLAIVSALLLVGILGLAFYLERTHAPRRFVRRPK